MAENDTLSQVDAAGDFDTPIPDYDPLRHIVFGHRTLGILGSATPLAHDEARLRFRTMQRIERQPTLSKLLGIDGVDAPLSAEQKIDLLGRLLEVNKAEALDAAIEFVAEQKVRLPFYNFPQKKRGRHPRASTRDEQQKSYDLMVAELRRQALKTAFSSNGKKEALNIDEAAETVAPTTSYAGQTVKAHFYDIVSKDELALVKLGPAQFLRNQLWRHNTLLPLDALKDALHKRPLLELPFEVMMIDRDEDGMLGGILARRLDHSVCDAARVLLNKMPAEQQAYMSGFGTGLNREAREGVPCLGVFYRSAKPNQTDSPWAEPANQLSAAVRVCGYKASVAPYDSSKLQTGAALIVLCRSRSLPPNLATDDYPASLPARRERAMKPYFRLQDGSIASHLVLPRISNLPTLAGRRRERGARLQPARTGFGTQPEQS